MPSVWIAALLLGHAPVIAQGPAEILAESHLRRAEQAIREGNLFGARAEINEIILLQRERELDLPDEFHFRSASVAAAASLPERVLEAAMKYLAAAGPEARYRVEALALIEQAQSEIAETAEPRGTTLASQPPASAASTPEDSPTSKPPSTPLGASSPFIQALRRLGTPSQKLKHLRVWNREMAGQNGISLINGIRLESLLDSFIFPYVNDEGSMDCKALEERLFTSMPDRCRFSESAYRMFNITIEELCPDQQKCE